MAPPPPLTFSRSELRPASRRVTFSISALSRPSAGVSLARRSATWRSVSSTAFTSSASCASSSFRLADSCLEIFRRRLSTGFPFRNMSAAGELER